MPDDDRETARRAYHAPGRAERARHTRARIVTAAGDLFRAQGYAATTVRAVAARAGVSVPTVELAFGTKPRLLKSAIDVAIAGDDEPVAVLQRDWARKAAASDTVAELLAIFGKVFVAAASRAAELVVAAYEAAPTDPEIKALAERQEAQRTITVGWLVDGLVARAPLRPGMSRAAAVDTVWLLMDPVVFSRLTRHRGWSPDDVERWFTDSIPRLLLAPGWDAKGHSDGRT
ncbi:MAG: TetR family transcriptional regulator [Actinophytocola sp.]|uniref:TetR/AcrR family transcriptional regulator n=1 Tax=Actinophytocola sp. TaxID=1872138 RepID=UPI00132A4BD1|nr:TetR family transcriptional regulator [Actinophytocola sp.]MPZ84930.1 TetR family transcriptional regulator [Actinophytocola sp.]